MKRWVIAGLAILVTLLVSAPFIAMLAVFVTGQGSDKFISAADGSTGPAFTFCLTVWGVLSLLAFVAGSAPIVYGAFRTRRPSP